MAFWGTEVKPGKPFTHITDNTRGRLHISQATLGFGTGERNSVVQCNVGNRSPVFLCSLFPEQAESCQLNLEFEEDDEVIFSVIGPRSVHLTGYYLGGSIHCKLDDESESYGEDIADTETEISTDEDEYEDSFIDDGDSQNIPPTPVSADGVADETLHKRKKKKEKPKYRRLRKKYQLSQSDDECASMQHTFANGGTCLPVLDSESEDRTAISSLIKSAARRRISETEKKAEKETGQTSNKEQKDGHNCSAMAAQNSDAVVDGELKSQDDRHRSLLCSAYLNSSSGEKPEKKMKKQAKEEKELEVGVEDDFFFGKFLKWDKAHKNETKADQSSKDMAPINGDAERTGSDKGENSLPFSLPSDELVHGIVAKSKKRKKRQAKGEKALGSESHSNNVNREDQAMTDDAKSQHILLDSLSKNDEIQKQANDENNVLSWNSQLTSIMLGHESGLKPKKRKKKAPEDLSPEADRRDTKIVEGEKASQDELKSDGIKCDRIFDKNANQSGNETPNRKRKKKKKSRNQENGEALNVDESMNVAVTDIKEYNADKKSFQSRTLSVIEELKSEKQDGKFAAPGKKVRERP